MSTKRRSLLKSVLLLFLFEFFVSLFLCFYFCLVIFVHFLLSLKKKSVCFVFMCTNDWHNDGLHCVARPVCVCLTYSFWYHCCNRSLFDAQHTSHPCQLYVNVCLCIIWLAIYIYIQLWEILQKSEKKVCIK